MAGNKLASVIVAALVGLGLLIFIPGLLPIALIAGAALAKNMKTPRRKAIADQMLEKLGLNREEPAARNKPDKQAEQFSNVREEDIFSRRRAAQQQHQRKKTDEADDYGDAFSYSSTDKKASSGQLYIGSTGKDPWDIPHEKPPWEL